MSTPKKLAKIAQKLLQQILQLSRTITKKLMNWLLRGLFVLGRSSRPSQVGFVLPTVVMVTLVVTLLVTAIMIRSFDRAKNASNIRVSEKVVTATSPAIDRANAKLKALLADPSLPRGTPTDISLYGAISGAGLPKYTFGDEKPLRLVYDFNGSSGIQKDETLDTAWRFPVDTDNNGKYDSYSLYGIYFRNPTANTRARSPLEARTPPMDRSDATGDCGAGTSAALVGSAGWFKTSDGNLRKSFYVFAATVPITSEPLDPTKYEKYKGNKGFAAIEVQQDQARIPLTNNAVVYEDDLEITPGAGIKLNGRIMTNGNFIIGQHDDTNIVRFYQVSSPNSCFYSVDNGKITVGGNVVLGATATGANTNVEKHDKVPVDLFQEGAAPTSIEFKKANNSVTNTAIATSFNSQAYAQRIGHLAGYAFTNKQLPQEVIDAVKNQLGQGTTVNTEDAAQAPVIRQALQNYFKLRTRRVPFAEVAPGADALTGKQNPSGTAANNDLRPQEDWIYPVKIDTGASNNKLALAASEPPATDPSEFQGNTRNNEKVLGDRILVGNGLPSTWWKGDPPPATTGTFVSFNDKIPQEVKGGKWTNREQRTRMTQTVPLSDVGDTGRDGFWERKAAEAPKQALADAFGGLRVVTGAGVYSPVGLVGTFLPRPNLTNLIADDPSTPENESTLDNPLTPTTLEGFPVVWPDTMPMWEDTNNNGKPEIYDADKKGDLVTRATAVYHYRSSSYDPASPGTYQKPIACVSSYYNPSTSLTAKNQQGLPNVSLRTSNRDLTGLPIVDIGSGGLSNNGVSYTPDKTAADITAVAHTNGLFTYTPLADYPGTASIDLSARLAYQANLIFPNGRFVNEPLRQAMKKLAPPTSGKLTLAEQSAIDSTICALQIADGTLKPKISDAVIPHGAIYETTFLDPRQVKAIESETPATATASVKTDYDLDIAERQPLEIRATVIDLDLLRRKEISGTSVVPSPEYLLPDSGIIYASRDDALPDLSLNPNDATLTGTADEKMAARRLQSPVDFRLDPTRRPNGIMLINGSVLARKDNTNKYKDTERGLILATNLPAYVKADAKKGFNLHQDTSENVLEEFKTADNLQANWGNFYTRSQLDPNFACRKEQPGLADCTSGDLWRPATVLADSVNLLSNNFRFGFRDEGDFDLRKNEDNLTYNLRFTGYDIDGSGGLPGANTFDENKFKFDLNGNQNATDPDVAESAVTITGARLLSGFFDNNYLTSSEWFKPDGLPKDFDLSATAPDPQGSSYVNNMVTPIQRRTNFPEYVMEMCRKPLVSLCQPQDWKIYTTAAPGGVYSGTLPAATLVADLLGTAPVGATPGKPGSGTTAQLPLDPAERRYPRRVAFLRDAQYKLQLDNKGAPVPLGIDAAGTVRYYAYNPGTTFPGITTTTGTPRIAANALWYKTSTTPATPTGSADYGNKSGLFYQYPLYVSTPASGLTPGVGTTQQPLLVPVLQLHAAGKTTLSATAANKDELADAMAADTASDPRDARYTDWMQRPIATGKTTTFNLIIATGDNPTRDVTADTPAAEQNGGMPNLPIFLESWNTKAKADITARISGSFIQYKRSAYATAPFLSVLNTAVLGTVLGYPQQYSNTTSSRSSPFYSPPQRQWGYDVGLLPQSPDLFAQQITLASSSEPNKFYREVGRSDRWVNTLLCAAVFDKDTGTYSEFALTDTDKPPAEDQCPIQEISKYNP